MAGVEQVRSHTSRTEASCEASHASVKQGLAFCSQGGTAVCRCAESDRLCQLTFKSVGIMYR